MNGLFADTYGFLAYLNPRDVHSELAAHYLTTSEETIVTTMWVLAEVGNFLAGTRNRRLFAARPGQISFDFPFAING